LPSAGICRKVLLFAQTTTKTDCEQKDPVLTSQLSLQNDCQCLGTVKGMLIWFSFGHLSQQFIAGIVKRFVQYHIFAQSAPGLRPNDKYPFNTSHCCRFV